MSRQRRMGVRVERIMMLKYCIYVLGFVLIIFVVPTSNHIHADTIYKCTDEKGRTIFSGTRCGADASQIELEEAADERTCNMAAAAVMDFSAERDAGSSRAELISSADDKASHYDLDRSIIIRSIDTVYEYPNYGDLKLGELVLSSCINGGSPGRTSDSVTTDSDKSNPQEQLNDISARLDERNYKIKEQRLIGRIRSIENERDRKIAEIEKKIDESRDFLLIDRWRDQIYDIKSSYRGKIRRAQDDLYQHRMSSH